MKSQRQIGFCNSSSGAEKFGLAVVLVTVSFAMLQGRPARAGSDLPSIEALVHDGLLTIKAEKEGLAEVLAATGNKVRFSTTVRGGLPLEHTTATALPALPSELEVAASRIAAYVTCPFHAYAKEQDLCHFDKFHGRMADSQ